MNEVQMAAILYECRDAAKRLLGDRYQAEMRELGKIVTNCATQEKCDPMAAGIHMAKMVDGMNVLMILAATVELIEPSNIQASAAGVEMSAKTQAGNSPVALHAPVGREGE